MPVHYDVDGAVAALVIDRPERRNAIDGPTADALQEHFESFAADDEARVLVLAGAGDEAFCAGADLKAFESLAHRAGSPAGFEGFTRLASPKPTIAAISGWCVAGGLELALWADLRIATTTARFGVLTRRHGLPFIDGGTQRLPRVVGLGRALDLILTGRTVAAEEALAIGLVNEVVPAGEHLKRALELAETIAAFPQETMLTDREAAHAAQGLPIDEGLALEARLGRRRLTGALEGARRFRVRP
jgi:enoyl-CoA hydratase